MEDLQGKVAIVTGAAGSIGSVTSRVLAQAGAKVTMVDIDEAKLGEVAALLGDGGHEVLPIGADITQEDEVADVVRSTVSTFGGVDILDNNAGGTSLVGRGNDLDVVRMTVEVWNSLMAINLLAPMLLCKHAIPSMVERGGGSIINISSGTSLAGNDTFTAYASSKGGLNTLTKYVATQVAAKGIRCNALALGLIPRIEYEPGSNPFLDVHLDHHIVGRLGEPIDIAEVVAFLASDRSAFITGQVISVDGGFSAHLPTYTNSAGERRQHLP